MFMPLSEFFNNLPARRCRLCSETLDEMADCYASICVRCEGFVNYPLSPMSATMPGNTSYTMHQL